MRRPFTLDKLAWPLIFLPFIVAIVMVIVTSILALCRSPKHGPSTQPASQPTTVLLVNSN